MSRQTTESGIFRPVPPPPRPGPVDLLLFREMEHEDDEFALLLWRRIRVASGSAPGDAGLEEAGAGAGAAEVQPSLYEAVNRIRGGDAGDHESRPLGPAFMVLSGWAEERGYLRTSAACAESSAYLSPADPVPAIQAGRLRRRLAEFDRAERWYERAAALARRKREWDLFIQVLLWHGFLHFQKAEYVQAERKYRSAGRAALRYSRRALAGVAHHNLLTLCSDLGFFRQGRRHAAKALSLYPVHFPRVPHLVHDYAFLLARNGCFSAALGLLERVYPLIPAAHERIVVLGNLARAAGGARRAERFESAADEVLRLAAASDENASRGVLGAADGAYCLGDGARALEFASRAIDLAVRRQDDEVQRLARVLIERVERQEPPPADQREPAPCRTLARECSQRLRRWSSPPRGEAADRAAAFPVAGNGDGTRSPRTPARQVKPDEPARFRSALRAAIDRSSLRAVARVVGMSPTGLSKFLEGKRPHRKTLELVGRWFARGGWLDGQPPERIADELRRLVGTLPDPDSGVGELLDAVDRSYRAAGMLPPGWIQRVREVVCTAPPTG